MGRMRTFLFCTRIHSVSCSRVGIVICRHAWRNTRRSMECGRRNPGSEQNVRRRSKGSVSGWICCAGRNARSLRQNCVRVRMRNSRLRFVGFPIQKNLRNTPPKHTICSVRTVPKESLYFLHLHGLHVCWMRSHDMMTAFECADDGWRSLHFSAGGIV